MTTTVNRISAPSGNRDNDYWQAACSACPWQSALYSNRTIEGRTLAERDRTEHVCKKRFTVEAMHKPSNGFDGPTQVDYWRVMDAETGLRANGSAKYETVGEAQRWCDAFNR